jgi:hypothetical protein
MPKDLKIAFDFISPLWKKERKKKCVFFKRTKREGGREKGGRMREGGRVVRREERESRVTE